MTESDDSETLGGGARPDGEKPDATGTGQAPGPEGDAWDEDDWDEEDEDEDDGDEDGDGGPAGELDSTEAEKVDWPAFLAAFHRDRPGIAEEVLSRAVSGEENPYRWLARAVSPDTGRVLDLACGSGPVSRAVAGAARTVIGLDLSPDELALARKRGPGPWVCGDARSLPFADESFDAVASSIGLVVVQPLDDVVSEIRRVLKPGGVMAAIAPALRPLAPKDIRVLSRVTGYLRAKPQFPGPVELAGFTKTLEAHGMRMVEDARERYRYPIRTRAEAELLMNGLYLPNTRRSRIEAALEYLDRRIARKGRIDIAIPMRRLVAIK